MRKISADYIFPVNGPMLKEAVIIIDEDNGRILDIQSRSEHDLASLEIYRGAIVPGFINTHCHLELSHMKGLVDTGTGLLSFLQKVVQFRDFPMEEILDAIKQEDQYMYDQGIVAVGDISNKADTVVCKNESPIRYYSFVEMFDFLQPDQAEMHFGNYKAVFNAQSDSNGNKKSCAPHAPYTVSPKLFELINEANHTPVTVSIHNQETSAENELFKSKSGGFIDWYQTFGFSLDHFEVTNKPSILYALNHMDPAQRTLFVHNTMTTEEDINAALEWNEKVYWATCPNANLYIENRLPNYQFFINTNAKVTIGTDSLTSNWQLSVLEEIKTIARYQSYVSTDMLLKWATLNGAEALGFEADLGSLEVGKAPGLNLLNLGHDLKVNANTQVRKLV